MARAQLDGVGAALSSRSKGPYIAQNATGIPASLIEAELFGCAKDYPEKGAKEVFAGRPKDLQDAESLLLLHRAEIDMKRVRRFIAQLAALSEQPSVLARLDDLAAATAPRTTKRRR